MALSDEFIAQLKTMSRDELQSLVDGYVRDNNLDMIVTTMLGLSLDGRRDVPTRALARFGRQGVEFLVNEIYEAPDQVAVFLIPMLRLFDSSLVKDVLKDVLQTRLHQFTGFKLRMLRRFTRRWWQFWK
jgi:hypothetical protein